MTHKQIFASGAVLAAALTIAACGGSTSRAASTKIPAGGSTSTAATTAGANAGGPSSPSATGPNSAAPAKTVSLNKTVWWGVQQGNHLLFKIHFTAAVFGPTSDATGITVAGLTVPPVPTLTVSFDAQNLQSDSRSLSFGAETTVTSHGKTAVPSGGDPLTVAANASTTGTVVFRVDPSFSLDDAVLTLGGADTNASVVPFAPSTPVTTFEPKVGFATGKLVGPDHDFAFQSSRLYADTTPGQKDKYVLVIEMRATFKGPDPGGGGLVGTGDFSLKAPSGSTVPGTHIVGEATEPLNANLKVGEVSPAEHVGFEIGAPVAGTYTLTYTAAQGSAQGQTGQTTFTVGA